MLHIFDSFLDLDFFALCFVDPTENELVWRIWSLAWLVRMMEKRHAQNRINAEVNKSHSYTAAKKKIDLVTI